MMAAVWDYLDSPWRQIFSSQKFSSFFRLSKQCYFGYLLSLLYTKNIFKIYEIHKRKLKFLLEWRRQNVLSWSNVRKLFCDFHYLFFLNNYNHVVMQMCKSRYSSNNKKVWEKFAIQFFVMFLVL